MSELLVELPRSDIQRATFDELWLPHDLVDRALGPLEPESSAAQLFAALPTLPVERLPNEVADASFRDLIVVAIREYMTIGEPAPGRIADDLDLWKSANRIRFGLAPRLKQLGMWDFKCLLEDRAFRAETAEFHDFECRFRNFRNAHEPLAAWVRETLADSLRNAGVIAQCKTLWCTVDVAWRRLSMQGSHAAIDRASSAHAKFDRARAASFFDVYVLMPDEGIEQCYRSIATIHEFGAPVPGGFEDFIASPRSNGFSGLVTHLSVEPPSAAHFRAEIARVIVQTELMNEVRRFGIVHPVCYAEAAHGGASCGYRFADVLVANATKNDLNEGPQKEPSDINVFAIGGRENKKTVWTIPAGSTVLDLAFRLHTQIGRWAESAFVNERRAELGHVLRRDDVVEIWTRPANSGRCPRTEDDLRLVTTKTGRLKIRKVLNEDTTSRGRLAIQDALRKRSVELDERHGLDAMAREVLNAFAELLDEPTVEELFRKVGKEKDKRVTAAAVAAAIARAMDQSAYDVRNLPDTPNVEWMPAVPRGSRTNLSHLRLCSWCRPVPSENTVGVEHARYITVHRDRCTHFRGVATLPIEWKRNDRTIRSVVTVFCDDRPRLVQSICERVASRGCGLEEIHATTNDRRATLTLHLYTNSALDLADLLQTLRRVRSVKEAKLTSTSLPPDQQQRLEQMPRWRGFLAGGDQSDSKTAVIQSTLAHGWRDSIFLPYDDKKPTYSPDWFFGREHEIRRLIDSLEASRIYAAIVGPRRIGKTSLALRCLDRIPANERPLVVRVDLRNDINSSSETVLRKIVETLKLEVPGPHEVASDMQSAIWKIAGRSRRRIVLILDEFGGPLQSFSQGKLGPELFAWIRTNMELPPSQGLDLILITTLEGAALLNDPSVHEHLDRFMVLDLSTIDPQSARDMVIKPFERQGVQFTSAAADKVVALAGGHPYFIIHVLQEVTQRINDGKIGFDITPKDVENCTERVLSDHTYNLRGAVTEPGHAPLNELCLRVLAQLQQAREFVPQTLIVKQARAAVAGITARSIEAVLKRCVEYKLLDLASYRKAYRFKIPLVQGWVVHNVKTSSFLSSRRRRA